MLQLRYRRLSAIMKNSVKLYLGKSEEVLKGMKDI